MRAIHSRLLTICQVLPVNRSSRGKVTSDASLCGALSVLLTVFCRSCNTEAGRLRAEPMPRETVLRRLRGVCTATVMKALGVLTNTTRSTISTLLSVLLSNRPGRFRSQKAHSHKLIIADIASAKKKHKKACRPKYVSPFLFF